MSYEKRLEAKVASLERRMAEIMTRIGMDQQTQDDFERAEAVDIMARTGSPAAIREYLLRVNARGNGGGDGGRYGSDHG